MKITTWNVNGIRSLKQSVQCILKDLDSDINCFQETKISRSQLPEKIALIESFTSYFSYPRKQSGYSGVATYCRDTFTPEDAEEGLSGVLAGKTDDTLMRNFNNLEESILDVADLDSEGRVIITYHLVKFEDEIRHLGIINIYCPRVDPEKPERHIYKMQFCHLLEAKVRKLCEDGCLVMIIGDMNIAYSTIDHCDPGDENEFNSSESRQWLNSFLSSKIAYFNGDIYMVDAFRSIHPDRRNAYTCWNTKIGARQTNFGTRIDYALISSNLKPLLLNCDILSDYEGSDHCPVFAELKCDPVSESSISLPSICTRLWPEFRGKQQTLRSFLKKTQDLPNSKESIRKKNGPKEKSRQKLIKSFFKSPSVVKEKSNELGLERGETVNSCGSSVESSAENAMSCSLKNGQLSLEWKSVLKGPPKPPLCSGHSKPCALRTVKKKGPNYGRQFFMCPQPAGHTSNPDSNCNFFKWVSATKVNTLK